MDKNMIKSRLLIIFIIVFSISVLGCNESTPPQKPATMQPSGNQKTEQQATDNNPYSNTVLKLGRIPFTNSSEMLKKHELFLDYLTKKLGVRRVTLQTAPDYSSNLKQIVDGKIDIAWMSTMTSVDARKMKEVELLVKPVRYGSTSYRGIIITRQDSGIKNLKDLKGKRFAWVEKESASAYIFPRALLLNAGINPDKDFSEVAFLGKHDTVVYNVLIGKYDACACYDDARTTLKDQSKINELTIIGRTEDICNEPIVVRSSLPEDLKNKLKEALLSLDYKSPEGKRILENLTDVQGFKTVDPRDYDAVEKVSNLTGIK